MNFLRGVYRFFLDAIQGIVIGGALAVFIFAFLFQPHEVSGLSMHATLTDKEYVITSLLDKHLDRVTRGDIIVFDPPFEEGKHFIKRVIGIGGDKVKVADGDVYVNSTRLDESAYLVTYIRTNSGLFLQEGKEVSVPLDSYLVMGDNRLNSSDSREWGFLKKTDLIGRSVIRIWPLHKITILQNPYKK